MDNCVDEEALTGSSWLRSMEREKCLELELQEGAVMSCWRTSHGSRTNVLSNFQLHSHHITSRLRKLRYQS